MSMPRLFIRNVLPQDISTNMIVLHHGHNQQLDQVIIPQNV
jgi:hypothetical protein